LGQFKAKFPFVGDVRGKGLLTAFELVSDRVTMAPLPAALNAFSVLVELAYERGLIIYSRRSRGGLEGDHFLICPPMITNSEQVTEILAILDDSLDSLAKMLNLPTSSP
jgi:adenosylmethionine-8-amino-7-oxononanoate aminotransferase